MPYLEKVCGANLSKLSYFMKQYFAYAARKGYKLSLTKSYQSKTKKLLRFSKSGNASIERRYSTRIIASMGENDHMKIKKDLSQMGMYTFVTSFLVRYFFMI